MSCVRSLVPVIELRDRVDQLAFALGLRAQGLGPGDGGRATRKVPGRKRGAQVTHVRHGEAPVGHRARGIDTRGLDEGDACPLRCRGIERIDAAIEYGLRLGAACNRESLAGRLRHRRRRQRDNCKNRPKQMTCHRSLQRGDVIKLGFIAESDLTRMLARQYRVPAVDLERVNVDQRIVKLVAADLARKHTVLPLRRVGRTLTLAMANPIDVAAIDAIKFSTRLDVEPVVVGEYTLKNHLTRYYPEEEKVEEIIEEREQSNLTAILSQIESDEDLEVIEEHDEEINLTQMQAAVETLM